MDHSDSVLRLSPTLQLEDGFAPRSWQSDNASDSDLGSMGPVLPPNGLIYADGKLGQGYVLRADHLGGIGGKIRTISLCSAYGGAAVSRLSLFIPSSDGMRQLQLEAGAYLVPGWQAPLEAYTRHFDDLFGKSNQCEEFRRYLEGLLLPTERHKTLT